MRRPSGGGGEVLLLEERGDGLWEALVRPSRRMRPACVWRPPRAGSRSSRSRRSARGAGSCGRRSPGDDLERALEAAGAAAAALRPRSLGARRALPDRLFARAGERRGAHGRAALHARAVGARAGPLRGRRGRAARRARPFRPVTAETLEGASDAQRGLPRRARRRAAIRAAAAAGRRVVCIGTTSVRVVETVADPAAPDEGRTALLIAPGYRFAPSPRS